MFLHLVCHTVHRGGLPQCMLGYHTPSPRWTSLPLWSSDTPPEDKSNCLETEHPAGAYFHTAALLLLRTVRKSYWISFFYPSWKFSKCLESSSLNIKNHYCETVCTKEILTSTIQSYMDISGALYAIMYAFQ